MANVTYRLDSLIALNEKNQKSDNPDKMRIAELESRLAVSTQGTEVQRQQLSMLKSDHEEEKRELKIKISLQEQHIDALKEQLDHANNRAFDAEGRLGREQALSRDLSAQLNLLKYGPKTTVSGDFKPKSDQEPAKSLARTELDDLELPDLDFALPAATPVIEASTVTKATHAIASKQKYAPSNNEKKNTATKKQDWDDIDNMLEDIGAGKK